MFFFRPFYFVIFYFGWEFFFVFLLFSLGIGGGGGEREGLGGGVQFARHTDLRLLVHHLRFELGVPLSKRLMDGHRDKKGDPT